MTILRERTVWKRDPKPRTLAPLNRLTPEQQENVKAALAVLRVRFGSLRKAAALMKTHHKTVTRSATRSGKPTPGLAIRVAELAQVPVDDVLDGRFPAPGCCPYCGKRAD